MEADCEQRSPFAEPAVLFTLPLLPWMFWVDQIAASLASQRSCPHLTHCGTHDLALPAELEEGHGLFA